jgi:hypothetical protein
MLLKTAQLPEVLAIDNLDRRYGCIEVVKQTRIDSDSAGAFVPTSVRFKSWRNAVFPQWQLPEIVMYSLLSLQICIKPNV